uniref:Uncharacterized protein n=1 Tax=Spironucleus salmonicida TaxID=348837 RepID=V6LUA5_9EUKA|eukprot:EST47286.1 Hypothetical protein SS50377_12633 [Spironucleus salmonicida]
MGVQLDTHQSLRVNADSLNEQHRRLPGFRYHRFRWNRQQVNRGGTGRQKDSNRLDNRYSQYSAATRVQESYHYQESNPSPTLLLSTHAAHFMRFDTIGILCSAALCRFRPHATLCISNISRKMLRYSIAIIYFPIVPLEQICKDFRPYNVQTVQFLLQIVNNVRNKFQLQQRIGIISIKQNFTFNILILGNIFTATRIKKLLPALTNIIINTTCQYAQSFTVNSTQQNSVCCCNYTESPKWIDSDFLQFQIWSERNIAKTTMRGVSPAN